MINNLWGPDGLIIKSLGKAEGFSVLNHQGWIDYFPIVTNEVSGYSYYTLNNDLVRNISDFQFFTLSLEHCERKLTNWWKRLNIKNSPFLFI